MAGGSSGFISWVLFAAAAAACVGLRSVAAAAGAAQDEKPVTFVFGDSLTDVGNNNYLSFSLAKSNYPWYGIDYDNGKPTGRFTNGRTIGDFISAKLGIPPPPPYLSLSANDDALMGGVNYASGGAGILNETGSYFIQKLSFDDQITYFENTKTVITAKIGEVAANKLVNGALYFIGLGSNDYVNNFLLPFLPDAQQYTHDEFVDHLVDSALDRQLRRLYQLGARKVVFHGVGPLGCIPSQRAKSPTGECLEQVNRWVQQFNSRVQKLLSALGGELPSSRFAYADSYAIVLDLIDRPGAYGFRVSNTSCCNVDSTVGGLCLPSSRLCANRTDYVFWDAYHPTDAANAVIARRLFAHPPAPAPAPAVPLDPSPTAASPTHNNIPPSPTPPRR